MRKLNRWLSGAVSAALLAAVSLTGVARNAVAQEASKWKDQAEFDLFDAAGKDIKAQNGAKALDDLNSWKQKYPDSFYKNDRESMFIQSYQLSKQYDKVLDLAKTLMGQNLDTLFPDPENGPRQVLQVLVAATTVINQIPNPSPDQVATAIQAAHMLKDYNRKPKSVSDADWATARTGIGGAADQTLFTLAVNPAMQAQTKKDWPTADAAWTKALADYPARAFISYNLGVVLRAEHKDDAALYELARTVAVDPTLGGTANGATITGFVTKYYTAFHGSPEGLDKLEETAKATPMPPADLHIKTAQEIAEAQQKEFETSHPDIALWLKLKATLTSDQGQQYFESSMKDAQVPELRGTVLESKCRAKELLVAVPLPDATGPLVPEITMKFATPLTGKVDSGQITFVGVASAFSRDPLMLTMTVDKKDIKDLKMTPCAAPAAAKKKKK